MAIPSERGLWVDSITLAAQLAGLITFYHSFSPVTHSSTAQTVLSLLRLCDQISSSYDLGQMLNKTLFLNYIIRHIFLIVFYTCTPHSCLRVGTRHHHQYRHMNTDNRSAIKMTISLSCISTCQQFCPVCTAHFCTSPRLNTRHSLGHNPSLRYFSPLRSHVSYVSHVSCVSQGSFHSWLLVLMSLMSPYN